MSGRLISDKDMLTLAEVASVYGCSERSLRRRRQGNKLVFSSGHVLPMVTLSGRGWRVSRVAWDRFLTETGREKL